MAFVDGFLMRHNVERFAGTLEGHGGSGFYHLVLLPILWLPWSPLLLPLLRRVREHWAEPVPRFLLGWAGFVLVFFSLSGTKLPHYGLYAAPAVCLLLGREAAHARPWARRWWWGGIVTAVLLMTLAPLLVQANADRIVDPLFRALIGGAPAPMVLGVAGLAWAALCLVLLRRGGRVRSWRPALAALGGAVLVTGGAVPWWGEALQGPIRRTGEAAQADGRPAVQWGIHWPSLAVYREASTPRRPPAPGELAVVRLDRLPEQAAALAASAAASGQAAPVLTVLRRERGVGLVVRETTP
jgi:4-amino-4-deoxy-L-arabinose transferase-like glycosyltransferase